MSRARLACTLALVATSAAAAGCQTFIGVEDVHGHLPRLDGMYLLGIHRVRAADGSEDNLRLRTMATLDKDARTLDLSYVILAADSDSAVAEGSITGIEFPPDATETTFAFQVQVPAAAVSAPPPTGNDRTIDVPDMLLRAEAEYSFCARPASGAVSPTFGTVLVASGAPLPMGEDVDLDCDEP